MKAIIVYYSLEGNSEYVADIIADHTKAEKLKLEPVKEYPKGGMSKFLWGGKSVMFGETPTLAPYQFDANTYDTIIIGTPIWASSYAPPIKTFLKENKLSGKRIALYACCAGGNTDKCFAKLQKELPDCTVVATLSLIDPKSKQSPDKVQKIEEFCKQLQG